MREIKFRGIIGKEYKDDGFYTITLTQEDNYKIDLVSRLAEAIMNYGRNVSIRYYTAPKRMPENEIQERFIKQLMGYVTAEFEKEHYQYSEYTSGTDYNTILDIGKHNLYNELLGKQGEYILLTISFEEEKKSKRNI